MTLALAAYQPDIPQNLGALLRLSACFGVRLHVIGPCSFPFSDARVRRAGMDYLGMADWRTHEGWTAFRDFARGDGRRLVLLTTQGSVPHHAFSFAPEDILLLGRESAGVPDDVRDACPDRIRIPLIAGARSLNVAVAAGIALAEGVRQVGGWNAP